MCTPTDITADATLVSIDLPAGRWASSPNRLSEEQLERLAAPGQSVVSIMGDSHDADIQRAARSAVGASVDFLFIDGDHSFDGVAHDYWAYQRLVRPGGLIVFHDIAEHPPASEVMVAGFWAGIKHRHPQSFEFTTPGSQWGGIGVLVK
jgi:predicted O-methyltransferase YrrM